MVTSGRSHSEGFLDCVAIIPARYRSVRFPGKPLATLQGRPLIAHVIERVRATEPVGKVVVATDDERIAEAAEAAGAVARMTPADLASGTDRVALAAREESAELIVNVQGDEPLLDPKELARAIRRFGESEAEFGTLRAPIDELRDLFDANVVKVVIDDRGRAMYFSRAPVPFPRASWLAADNRSGEPMLRFELDGDWRGPWWIHVGVYLFRRRALERWARMPPSTLEQIEGLEQLRLLQAGETMLTFPTRHSAPGVDTPEDLERVARSMASDASFDDRDTGGANG